MLKPFAALAALMLSAAAFAQTTTISPNSQQVQLLAPQLVAFAGSAGNFDSLVNGLTVGTPITLTTVSSDGFIQVVTFMPGITMSTADTARALETARQNLIVRGVAAPTAQQLAIALMGGSLTTAAGSTPLPGVLSGTAGTSQLQIRNEVAFPGASALNLSAANLQALRTGLAQGSPVTLTSTSAAGAVQSVTFTPTSGPMNAFEVNQALSLASALLAQQGVLNPTPDQIRVALMGGTLSTVSGLNVPVQGVLQGRVRMTSESPLFGTSNSRLFGTSNTPPSVAPVVTGPPPTTTTTTTPSVEGVRRPNTAEGANRVRRGG
jgi:hypothetical protein